MFLLSLLILLKPSCCQVLSVLEAALFFIILASIKGIDRLGQLPFEYWLSDFFRFTYRSIVAVSCKLGFVETICCESLAYISFEKLENLSIKLQEILVEGSII